MAKPKITEEDLFLTESLIGESFARLKTSIAKTPSDLVRPVSSTVREHPFATAAAAAGVGMIVFRIMKMFTPRVVVREVPAHHNVTVKEGESSSLVTQLMGLAMPYIAGMLQQELSRWMANRQHQR